MADAYTYVMIHNIPQNYRSCDLRDFFSQLIETGAFRCFHFRHRPEVQKIKDFETVEDDRSGKQTRNTCCCIAMVQKARLEELLTTYDGAFWVTKEGETLNSKCHIRRVIVANEPTSNQKRYDRQNRLPTVCQSDLREMIELRPPPALPAGNVGTPTRYILKQINKCQFPVRLIASLGLEFPRLRAKGMYGSVSLDYDKISGKSIRDTEAGASTAPSTSRAADVKRVAPRKAAPDLSDMPTADQVPTFARTTKGHLIASSHVRPRKELGPQEDPETLNTEGSGEKDDELSDDGEEWDRHEALHDDVTSQERNKERLFEEGMEVVWEKGGSGLVFYTDAQHWDETEGDFDAKTSDDWDLDMSGYRQDGAGDKDARDMISMRNSEALRKQSEVDENRVGFFENFTKGVGRKILEKQGWTEGSGVGLQQGILEPISEDWKHPNDRSGLGFRGEKLERRRLRTTRSEADEDRLFSAVYDEHFGQDGHGITGRSELPSVLKYRKKFVKDSGKE
ncbi:G patch domain-containing protein 3 [Galendromus occidentalis]|uniref:G patch domain-containing protein 3 n=1 Tax=Galendromus occidentalis TaxID=34638 RepID=A0AAJ6QV98_9ACAR|nr:G patch domain-containing protein 3 [Galendromus occidentalis]